MLFSDLHDLSTSSIHSFARGDRSSTFQHSRHTEGEHQVSFGASTQLPEAKHSHYAQHSAPVVDARDHYKDQLERMLSASESRLETEWRRRFEHELASGASLMPF